MSGVQGGAAQAAFAVIKNLFQALVAYNLSFACS